MMPAVSRRAALLLIASASLLPSLARAADQVLRVGYQKYGNLILLKAHGGLEEALKPLGYTIEWAEFPSGPPLLEAMNAGAIDIGQAGEAPPIFAQAAGTPLLYIAAEPPAPRGEAILVPRESTVRAVADLKGKRVALNKGSNVHYLLVSALEKAGVAYGDITPVFLAPADGRAAFEGGSVDAWAVWDPYLAAAQAATGARTLPDGEGIAPNVQFYFATRSLAAASPQVVSAVVAAVEATDRWAARNTDAVADELGAAIRLPKAVVATALARQTYGVASLGPDTIAGQQRVADAFYALKLLPKPLNVADAVWSPAP